MTSQERSATIGPSGAAPQRLGEMDWLFAAALVVAVLLVYQPAWHGGFLWDDDTHITRPDLRSVDGLYRIWFKLGTNVQYYPLLHTAFWIEHRIWGDKAFCYHLLNIVLHAVVAIMAGMVLRRLKIPGAFWRRPSSPCTRSGRVGGVDHRAEEHSFGRVLHGRHAGLSCFDQTRKKSTVRLGVPGVRGWPCSARRSRP